MAYYRIRDPLHNLIAFDTKGELERTLWDVVNSRPFQRLRRIKQLGFSEVVFPGATHTRFTHSLGVFHTARKLMEVVKRFENRFEGKENIALAAALLHDVGHGPFSHAFEKIGEELEDTLDLRILKHEHMSDWLIRNDEEIAFILQKMGKGFAEDVAKMIVGKGVPSAHSAVVSSQFDADRLDYIRRDRLMTGSNSPSIDLDWLLDNLELVEAPAGLEDEEVGTMPTFVIGPKAVYAAEAYIVGLFHLYPTVYYHKTTRGVERLFVELLSRLIREVQDGYREEMVGLPKGHPLVLFAQNPGKPENVLSLDDTVVWGALFQLQDSGNQLIKSFAQRLLDRKLFKCVDVRTEIQHHINPKNKPHPELDDKINVCCEIVRTKLTEFEKEKRCHPDIPAILVDTGSRSAYKTVSELRSLAESICIKTEGGEFIDLKERSLVVGNIKEFRLTRVYYDREQATVRKWILELIKEEAKRWKRE